MLVKTVQENVFNTEAKHIAFAVNTEGYNDAGFAGQVCEYWPEIANCGPQELGTVMSKKVGDKTFHALVCHSLHNGWGNNQREVIKDCFDKIPTEDDEPIATIAIGTGFVGMLSGADFKQIAFGMHDSKKPVILHAGYKLSDIISSYNKDKKASKQAKQKAKNDDKKGQ